MAGKISVALLLLVFSLMAVSVHGSAIKFTSSTSSIQPFVTSPLTLLCDLHDTIPTEGGCHIGRGRGRNCSMENTSFNVDFVTSIVISKDGVDVATLSEHVPATALLRSPDVHVTGSLSGQAGQKGHLEVTFDHPSYLDAGRYKCEIASINSQGHSFDFAQAMEIVEEELTMRDLVRHVQRLNKEKENLEKTVLAMNQTIEKLNQSDAKTKEDNANMKETIKSQGEEMIGLEQTVNNLATQVNTSLTRVFFSAGLSNSLTSSAVGQVVVFNKVWSNVGDGYSSSTGIFTCPVAGYYRFVASLVTGNNRVAYLEIQVNGRNVFRVLTRDTPGYNSATNSAIFKLDKHDKVRAVTLRAGDFFQSLPTEEVTTFSGQLVSIV